MAGRADDDAAEPIIALEAAVDEAIAACDGDARAAVRALLVTLDVTEREVAALKAEVVRIEAAVSDGYVRGKLKRQDRS